MPSPPPLQDRKMLTKKKRGEADVTAPRLTPRQTAEGMEVLIEKDDFPIVIRAVVAVSPDMSNFAARSVPTIIYHMSDTCDAHA